VASAAEKITKTKYFTLDDITNNNYDIQTDNSKIVINYKKSPRDWFHFIYSSLIGTILIFFSSYLLYSIKHFSWTTNTIIGICFCSLVILWALYKLVIACEILFLPTKSIIAIDKLERTITVKLIFFRTLILNYDDIKLIQLSGHDNIVEDYHRGQTYKRRLFYHQLQFVLKDGQVKKIHKFFSSKIFIPIMPKIETHQVSVVSKQIAKLIAAETGIKYIWLGTKETAETKA